MYGTPYENESAQVVLHGEDGNILLPPVRVTMGPGGSTPGAALAEAAMEMSGVKQTRADTTAQTSTWARGRNVLPIRTLPNTTSNSQLNWTNDPALHPSGLDRRLDALSPVRLTIKSSST